MAERSSGLDALYPFLYGGGDRAGAADAVLEDVRRSTVAKVEEITALRARLLEQEAGALLACARTLARSFAGGGKLLTFGNGGSATDAQDVAHTFLDPPGDARPLPAYALTAEVPVLTALANDVGFDVVFARQIAAAGQAGDVALGLSTSGGSENVLRAFEQAQRQGLHTVGFAGYDGGRMAEAGTIDHLFVVPSPSVHRIQEGQTTLYHVLWELTQQALELEAAR